MSGIGIEVKVKKLREDAVLPEMATLGSAGADLRACLPFDEQVGEQVSKVILAPKQKMKIGTGLAFQLPMFHVMLICPRSSMGIKKGLVLQNTIGVLDSDYRGECFLFVKNVGNEPIEIEHGERIAQAVVVPYPIIQYKEVEELDSTERGEGGFGSTGKM